MWYRREVSNRYLWLVMWLSWINLKIMYFICRMEMCCDDNLVYWSLAVGGRSGIGAVVGEHFCGRMYQIQLIENFTYRSSVILCLADWEKVDSSSQNVEPRQRIWIFVIIGLCSRWYYYRMLVDSAGSDDIVGERARFRSLTISSPWKD